MAAGDDRRRHGDLRRHAVGVHPRAGVPGPDQGQAGDARGGPHRRGDACATPSTIGSPPRRSRPTSSSTGSIERADERAAPPPGEGGRAQDRDAQAAPARQARRLHQGRRRGLRALHRRGRFGRRLRQAGARPRDPGGAAPARKNPQRRLGRQDKLGQNQQLSDLVQALGCGTGAALPRRRPALREGRHHDGRRRRRRPHRLAPDHLLLPADAAAHRRAAISISPCRRSIG